VVVQQEPALAGSSQATAVEIPDDDVLPPGWDQWASLPTPVPRAPGGGACEKVGRPHGGQEFGARRRGFFVSRGPPCSERPSGEPGAGAGARRRAAPSLRRRARGAAAVGGAPWPRSFAQPGAKRGVADPRRPARGVSSRCVDVRMLVAFFLALVVFAFICAVRYSRILSAGGRSWSSAPATGTAHSTR
jgi:hypothetical protein